MAVITTIKEKILTLDAGSFQSLCDSYLSQEGYPNIVSLGSHAGSQKTTKGTPDTFFFKHGEKYIFVEYTTQTDGLIGKIRDDIKKCLDNERTNIELKDISEIIYCHTSSNIAPKYDQEFRCMCEIHGIMLKIIGIDQLAQDLYSKYRFLAKDHLGVTIDTGQIQRIEEFVKNYDSNDLSAPLNMPFLFRDEDLKKIQDAYANVNVVILAGPAGVGKTKLALQYAEIYADECDYELYCIHNRSLPLYDDLCMFFDIPGRYFIVIDDANQLSNPEWIVEYANKKQQGYDVKILITVRDYAMERVASIINNIVKYETITISSFSDKEIKSIVRESLKITNDDYLDRIARISEGNTRMAVLAGKVAKDANTIESIDDISDLCSEYYGRVLRESDLNNKRELLISAGIVAFLNAVHLEQMEPLQTFLEEYGLSKDTFIYCLQELHCYEIVDIYHDKVVRFSEQCLSNFMLKYVFYDEKIISLSAIVKACFKSFKSRVIVSINTMINVFFDENLLKYVKNEIKRLWDELRNENSPQFMEYVRSFYRVNPTETMILIDEIIDEIEEIFIPVDEVDTASGKNYQNISDDILNILGGFADSQDIECALDIFFKYYLKRPDKYIQFYHAIVEFFGIREDSWKYSYNTVKKFIEKMIEYSDGWSNEYILILFLDISKYLLQLHFSPSGYNDRTSELTIYNVFLVKTEGVENYRRLIWEQFSELLSEGKGFTAIKQILYEYGNGVYEDSIDVVESDAKCIIELVENYFSKELVYDCLIVRHLHKMWDKINLSYGIIDEFLTCKKMTLYELLEGPRWTPELKTDGVESERNSRIKKYFEDSADSVRAFKELLFICIEVASLGNEHRSYKIRDGLETAMEIICENDGHFLDVLNYIMENEWTNYIRPDVIIKKAFNMFPADEVYTLIRKINTQSEYDYWMYQFFLLIPKCHINEKMFRLLLEFLSGRSDENLPSSATRDIDFLENFKEFDSDIFINGVKLIFDKRKYSDFAAFLYLHLLFNKWHISPELVVEKFSDDIQLLEDIYIWMELYNHNNDIEGDFLWEINKADNKFIEKYIREMCKVSKLRDLDDKFSKLCIAYSSDTYLDIMDNIIELLIELSEYPDWDIPDIVERLIIPKKGCDSINERIDLWIKHYICKKYDDKIAMRCLFEASTRCNRAQRLEYIRLFLEKNMEYEDFADIPLTPRMFSSTGSVVPIYASWVDFLSDILPMLTGLKYIRHKKYIEDKIDHYKKLIIKEQVSEIMRK